MYVCVQATNGIYVPLNLNFFSEDHYLIHHGGRSRNHEKNCPEKRATVRKIFKPRTTCRISVSCVHGCPRASDSYHNLGISAGLSLTTHRYINHRRSSVLYRPRDIVHTVDRSFTARPTDGCRLSVASTPKPVAQSLVVGLSRG